jgi:HK97 family phage major capsid protein
MKIGERITEAQKQRAAKADAMQALLDASEKDGRALNADEQKSFDEIEGDIKAIDETLVRLRKHESIMASKSSPVIEMPSQIKVGKGIRFARMCQAIASGKGNLMQAMEIAKSAWPQDGDIHKVIHAQSMGVTRAAVAAGTTTDPAWAGSLVAAETLAGELIELVMAEAILGQLTQLRRVPFNVRIPRETVALGSVGWVGEGMSKPVGKGGYDFVTIPWAKCALIVVITEELARFSNPAAEGLMRDALVRALVTFLDSQFVNSALAPVAGTSPGGITNGLPAGQIVAVAGTPPTLADVNAALVSAVTKLNAVNAPRSPAWIMDPLVFISLASAQNGLGQPVYPTLNQNKTLFGYPVITSATMANNQIILLDQYGVLFASDPSVTVDVSREASVQLDSAPATPPTPLVSFWQQNLIGLKAEQYAYWMRAHDTDVVLINNAVIPTGLGLPTPTTEPCPVHHTDPCPPGVNPRKWAQQCAALEAAAKSKG